MKPISFPDLILHHGHIATQDERRSSVEAVSITAGRFNATGLDLNILALRGSGTEVIDLNRRTVVPGLDDSHKCDANGCSHSTHQLFAGAEASDNRHANSGARAVAASLSKP